MSHSLPFFVEFSQNMHQDFLSATQQLPPAQEANSAAQQYDYKSLTPIMAAFITAAATLIAATFGLSLSATLFKWNESWHNAEQVSRALYAILSNYARHGVANMRALVSEFDESSSSFKVPAKEVLQRQKFETVDLSEKTKERTALMGEDIVYLIERLVLVIRNVNYQIDGAIYRRDSGEHKYIESRKYDMEDIFVRNLRIVMMANDIASQFNILLEENKRMTYSGRFKYIVEHRATIFTDFHVGIEPGYLDRYYSVDFVAPYIIYAFIATSLNFIGFNYTIREAKKMSKKIFNTNIDNIVNRNTTNMSRFRDIDKYFDHEQIFANEEIEKVIGAYTTDEASSKIFNMLRRLGS